MRGWQLIFLFGAFSLVFMGCEKAKAPAYLHIPAWNFVSQPGQGTESQKITELWVYQNEQLLGIYSTPANIPIIDLDRSKIQILAGIKNNGLSDSRIRYPFFQSVDTTLSFSPEQTVTWTPKFGYDDNVDVEELGFESGNFLLEMSGNNGDFTAVTDPSIVFEGNRCGKGVLTSGQSKLFYKDDVNREFTAGNYYFLEMNYSCNNRFSVGLIVTEATGETKEFVLSINPTQETDGVPVWNKIYVDFGSVPLRHLQAIHYEFYVEAVPDVFGKPVEVYLDNLKWVKWQ
jgi:hypothetical protein